MMATKKPGAGISRPKSRASKQGGMTQFIIIGVAVVAVIVLVLVVFGGKKPAAATVKRVASGVETAVKKPVRSSGGGAARVTAADRKAEEKERRREERRKLKEQQAASRTRRGSTGGYARSGGTKSGSSDPNQVRAIIVDASGTRYALVGERRVRAGDDIGGRRVSEVDPDAIKVDMKGTSYTVRVGQSLP